MILSCNKTDGQDFINVIQAVSNINSEGKIIFTENKVIINVVDLSKVMLLSIEMDKTMFNKYEVKENTTLGTNFDILHKTIKGFKDGFVMMRVDNKIMVNSEDGKTRRIISELPVDENENPMPKFDYENIYEIDLEHFVDSVETAIDVDEVCKIEGDEKIILSANRVMEELETEIDSTLHSKNNKQTIHVSLIYLVKLKPLKKVMDKIKLHLRENTPLTITHSNDKINMVALIAPRMMGNE